MTASLRDALRERLRVRSVFRWAGLVAFLWYVLDPSAAQFATTLVSLTLFGLTEVVSDVCDLRESVRYGGFGVYALVSGSALALFDDGTTWLPVVFLLVGLWFLADAVQTVRHEGATEAEPTGREVYRDYVARQVHEALADGPRTRREFHAELPADDETVDAAIDRLESRGAVVREGSAVRTAERDADSAVGRLRDWTVAVAGRTARPVTLELGDGGTDVRDVSRPDGPVTGTGQAVSDRPGRGAESPDEAEREYEPVD